MTIFLSNLLYLTLVGNGVRIRGGEQSTMVFLLMLFGVSLVSFTIGYIQVSLLQRTLCSFKSKQGEFKKNTSSLCMTFAFDDTSQASRTTTHDTSQPCSLNSAFYIPVSAFRRTIYLLHLLTHIALLAVQSCQTNQRLLENKTL